MAANKIDKWVWRFIYGGMLGFSLGWFVQGSDAALGAVLMAGGGVTAAIGVALIFVRARLGP